MAAIGARAGDASLASDSSDESDESDESPSEASGKDWGSAGVAEREMTGAGATEGVAAAADFPTALLERGERMDIGNTEVESAGVDKVMAGEAADRSACQARRMT